VNSQAATEQVSLLEGAYTSLVDALRDSGAGWTRWRIDWDDVEPLEPQPGRPPSYRWQWNDGRLRNVAAGAGVRLLINVADAPTWAASEPCAQIYPDRLDEYARFLTDLVNHYKGPPYFVRHWELFNEPDYDGSRGCTKGYAAWGNEPIRYVQMLQVAYPAIKAADPEATVILGGLAYDAFVETDGVFLRYFIDGVIENGGVQYLDALNIHYFTWSRWEWERWTPENPPTCGIVDDGVGTPYDAYGVDVIAKLNHFGNRMFICHGVQKPIWLTELGRPDYPWNPDWLIGQARYAIQGHVRALSVGVEQVTWYALSTPSEQFGFQLLTDDWTPKPSFYAYQTLTSELIGHEYASTLDLADGEGYVFQDASHREKTVAWGSGTLAFAPAGRLRVVDREGNESFIVDGGPGDQDGMQNGAVELQLSADPVFVTVVS
jgi:hypothetical protein